MSQVQQLYRLQQYDSEIAQKKQRLAEVVKMQRETQELLAARKRFNEASAKATKWTTTQTDLELELGTVNDEARRSENRLYSGQVTNPKELEDLQLKVESLGRRRGVLEDQILEAMIMLEDAQEELSSAEKSLKQILSEWEVSQESLKAEQNELALALHKLIGERQKQADRIDAKAYADYESIRARKNGLAVVPFVNNTCMGCHVTVSANMALRVERGELVTCNGCGRILVLA
jgi:predicted  nucleic acid-binding Zn-ribbon protein